MSDSQVIKVGDILEVALSTTDIIPVGKKFEVLADKLDGRDVYVISGGYNMTIVNKHPMLDGIGVIFKKSEEAVEAVEVVEHRLVPNYGDLMTLEDFEEAVESGCFTNDDGSAQYSDGVHVFDYADIYGLDKNYSHVVWYNK